MGFEVIADDINRAKFHIDRWRFTILRRFEIYMCLRKAKSFITLLYIAVIVCDKQLFTRVCWRDESRLRSIRWHRLIDDSLVKKNKRIEWLKKWIQSICRIYVAVDINAVVDFIFAAKNGAYFVSRFVLPMILFHHYTTNNVQHPHQTRSMRRSNHFDWCLVLNDHSWVHRSASLVVFVISGLCSQV